MSIETIKKKLGEVEDKWGYEAEEFIYRDALEMFANGKNPTIDDVVELAERALNHGNAEGAGLI